MIKATCFTNIDEFKTTEWPTAFVALLRVGDFVEGKGGPGMGRPKLRICAVTHRMDEPALLVELHR